MHKILVEELYFGENTARCAVENIRMFDERLQPILDQWMKDRTLSDVAINGVTIDFVMKHKKCNFYKALVSLAVFAEHPGLAEHVLKHPVRYGHESFEGKGKGLCVLQERFYHWEGVSFVH